MGVTIRRGPFVHKCLVDQYADDVTFDQKSYFDEYEFYIDYGMKPGALDLEKRQSYQAKKEMIMLILIF